MTTETNVDSRAISILVTKAVMSSGSCKTPITLGLAGREHCSAMYQSKVKPSQRDVQALLVEREDDQDDDRQVEEDVHQDRPGGDADVAVPHDAVPPRELRLLAAPDVAWEPEAVIVSHQNSSVPDGLHVQDDDAQHHQQQDVGQRRAQGPVTVRREGLVDQPAPDDHLVAAEDRRDDELAGGRDGGQHAAGEDAGQGQRQRDLHQGRPLAGAEVLGGLEQRLVDLLDPDEQRQHHERQIVVDQAEVHRLLRVHDVQRRRR